MRRATHAAVLAVLGLGPACLLAPPRPGSGSDDAGPGDAATACGCAGDPEARLPLALVMPGTLLMPEQGDTSDVLVRAGTCHGVTQVLVHEVTPGGGFSARCPTRTLTVPRIMPAEPRAQVARGLAPFDATSVAVFVELPGTGNPASGQIAVYRVPLDGSAPVLVASAPTADALPVDAPGFVAVSAAPARVAAGVGPLAWSAAIESVTVGFGAPTRTASPVITALAPQRTTGSAVDEWAVAAADGDYQAADLSLMGMGAARPFLECVACTRIAHAGPAPAPAVGDVIAHSITAEGDLSLILRGGTVATLRTNVGVPGEAEVVDVAVRTEAATTRIAILGKATQFEGGLLALAPLALTTTVTPGTWATTPLVPPLELPARVLVGRFGGAVPRVVAVSDQPAGAGRRDGCFEVRGANRTELLPCL